MSVRKWKVWNEQVEGSIVWMRVFVFQAEDGIRDVQT